MSFRQIPSRWLRALAFCGACLLLGGCGQFFPPLSTSSGSSGSSSGDYLYVGNLEGGNLGIAGFTFANSTLTSLSGSPYTAVAAPYALAITPDNSYLYVGGGVTESIAEYPISSTGTLGSGSVVASFSPATLEVDTTGTWLIGIDVLYNEVYAFQIDTSTGGLSQPLSSSVVTLPNCDIADDVPGGLAPGLVIAPDDNYVYASCGTAGIYVLTFDSSTGALTETGQVRPAATDGADSGLAIATTSSASYLLAPETVTNGVRVFSISSTDGQISQVSGSPFSTGSGPDAVLVDSTDSYVYVANRAAGTISGFTLGSDGALTAISGSPFATGALPVALVEDNSHTYVAAICYGGNADLETYTIGTAGALVSFKNSSTGTDPTQASSAVATP
ncbi:MAG TPA: beta-propeller fold lactonase family protein [Acidobacteriaceae bacterium]|nr:beta-propeller fold lactonase family protein [Acidobacteriaceae bacterium]